MENTVLFYHFRKLSLVKKKKTLKLTVLLLSYLNPI